jgi:hypothetical protein
MKVSRFTIRTDRPGVEVSWQVTGIRQDAWANSHRTLVEEEKQAVARGTCLHPEEHGQARSKDLASLHTPRGPEVAGSGS